MRYEKVLVARMLLGRISVKLKSCHDANFVITVGPTGCHYDNLWCYQRWQSWHHDNSPFSVMANLDNLTISIDPGKQLYSPDKPNIWVYRWVSHAWSWDDHILKLCRYVSKWFQTWLQIKRFCSWTLPKLLPSSCARLYFTYNMVILFYHARI